jgi:hypothetical protein
MSSISRRSLLVAAALTPLAAKARKAEKPDHFQLGVPDLDEGIKFVKDLTGVEPVFGGAHPGYGTRNALISLGEGSYLEILALDPAQSDVKTPRTERIRALSGPTILTFAMQTTDIARKLSLVERLPGFQGKLDPRSRKKPDGTTVEWTNLPIESPFGPQMPFFIDWKGSPHPSQSAPAGCKLFQFKVLHPEAERLRDAYRQLEIYVAVDAAPKPGFLANVATPNGTVSFTG